MMTDQDDTPVLARVYMSTVQRIFCHLKLFSSNATYIMVSDLVRKIYVWVGCASLIEDIVMAESVAFDILKDDFQNVGEIVTIKEGMENQQKLIAFLDQLNMTVDDYEELSSLRGSIVENVPITLSVIERRRVSSDRNDDFVLKPISHSAVGRSGTVPPLPFLSIVDRKTIAILTTGNQYDIWFAEAVSRREKVAVKAFIVEMSSCKVPLKHRAFETALVERSLCLVGQERSTSLFRENFTSNNRYLISSNTKLRTSTIRRKSVNSTHDKGSQQKCSDCVGDAILRLLGISSKPSPAPTSSSGSTRSNTNFSSHSSMDDDVKSTSSAATETSVSCSNVTLSCAFSPSVPSCSGSSAIDNCLGTGGNKTEVPRPLSPPRPGQDTVSLKLQRLASRTEIIFINQPRRNTKLLVLDLDHTLMDFSCRFDYMPEQLKRPFLDSFLAQSYLYYDIAVWSQTNFKWLELKLTELGMLNRRDYKICFALDKSTMFTVRQQYVKPLEVIWAKCASLGWGPHNTIHVDDLERNFELNKQSGVLISPFHLKPFAISPYDGLGESLLDGTSHFTDDFESSQTDTTDHHNGTNGNNGNGNHNGNGNNGNGNNGNGNSNNNGNNNGNKDTGNGITGPGSAELPLVGPKRCDSLASVTDNGNKSFEDVELQLLTRYLVYIAVTVSDFSSVDHSLWRTRALEMPNDL